MDPDAFGILYERFFPQVWAYAVGRFGRQRAEDVVSRDLRGGLAAWDGYPS